MFLYMIYVYLSVVWFMHSQMFYKSELFHF